jgi:cell division protein FtsB
VRRTLTLVRVQATRLADTVRKVEQRMKDIERQTSSCRKELADECERHHKEETRLTKEIKTVKSELDKEKEKNER